jgi:HK97 gp10 family phage protein
MRRIRGAGAGRIEGMTEAREALQQLGEHAQKIIGREAVNAAADLLVPEVARGAPVSGRARNPTPGSLQRSVRKRDARRRKTEVRVEVIADDVAAVPNEFGTSKMAAQPFFRPAVDRNRERAARAVADTVKDEVENGPWVKG